MKISKRLLAVLMAVVMILTIVPLGLFVFAEGDPEPQGEEPKEEPKAPHEIYTLADFNMIGKEEDWLLSDDYVLANDIIQKTVFEKMSDWLDASEENRQKAGVESKLFPNYILDEDTYDDGTQYYKKLDDDSYVPISFDETTEYEPNLYYVQDGTYQPLTSDMFNALNGTDSQIAYDAIQAIKLATDGDSFVGDDYTIEPVSGTFTGTFDGQNHKITGVSFKKDSGNACGLFEINNGTIKDFTTDVIIEFHPTIGNLVSVGGIAALNAGKIENCCFDGAIFVIFGKEQLKSDNNELSSIYSMYAQIGGIAGISAGTIDDATKNKVRDDIFIDCDYVGGENVSIGKIVGSDNTTKYLSSYERRVTSLATLPDDKSTSLKKQQVNNVDKYELLEVTDESNKLFGYHCYVRTVKCAHSGATKVEAKASTCTTKGNKEYWTCPDCKLNFIEKPNINSKPVSMYDIKIATDITNHDASKVTKTDAKTPTCTAAGNIEYFYCSTCREYMVAADDGATEFVKVGGEGKYTVLSNGKSDTVVAKLPHTPTHHDRVEPTYDTTGNKEYWQCNACKQYFLEEACTKAVDYNKNIVLAKLVPPTVTPKSSSGYKSATTGGKNTIILPNPSNSDGVSIASFKSNLQDGYEYVIKDAKGSVVSSGPIGTNYTVEIRQNGTLYSKTTVIVRGDIDCNGVIRSGDYIKVKKHIRKTSVITDPILLVAANVNADSNNAVNSGDYIRIKNIMRNK